MAASQEWMYIPLSLRASPSSEAHGGPGDAARDLHHHAESRLSPSSSAPSAGRLLLDGRALFLRQFSDNPVQNVNVRTGVIVGVILGIFLICVVAFCCIFHKSVRFSSRKKRRHRRKSGSSKSSKSSKGSKDGGPPPEEAPAG